MARTKKQRTGGGVIEYPTRGGDVVFRIQYRTADGRQVKETLGRASQGWTRTMAKDERKKRVAAVTDGYVRPEGITFVAYASEWLENRKRDGKARGGKPYAESTLVAYKQEVETLTERFGSRKLRDLTTSAVDAYKRERIDAGDGRATISRTLTVLGMIVGQAVEDGYIEPHKRPNVKSAGKGDFNPRTLTVAEARAIEDELAKNADPQVRLIFVSLERLGTRISELRGIRWQDVDFQEATVRITKSKSRRGIRTLYVAPELLAEWEAWRKVTPYAHDEDFLFTNSTGTSYRPDRKNGYYESFHRACRKIGIEEYVRPGHDMRATFITEGIKSGASAPAVMYMAGHESFATTKMYADLVGHSFEDEMRRVAERRSGDLRVIEGGAGAEGDSNVQEAVS